MSVFSWLPLEFRSLSNGQAVMSPSPLTALPVSSGVDNLLIDRHRLLLDYLPSLGGRPISSIGCCPCNSDPTDGKEALRTYGTENSAAPGVGSEHGRGGVRTSEQTVPRMTIILLVCPRDYTKPRSFPDQPEFMTGGVLKM
ncbi:hypothetical protein BaRGS_00016815, partial [Batillaria attramentaria]